MDNHLQKVQQNLALQKPETGQPASSDEQRFALSLKEKKVKELPEIALRQALRYAMMKVGLRGENFPKGAEKALLLQHVWEHYGNHTPAEIRQAFDMALEGKLDMKPEDVKCYENFSCAYFSQVMNAYRRWAAQVWEQHQKKAEQIEYKPDMEQIEREYQEYLKWLETPAGSKYKPL